MKEWGYKYQYFGFNVLSDFEIPELAEKQFGIPDVVVGAVPTLDARYADINNIGLYFLDPGCLLFVLEDNVRVSVERGRQIQVEHALGNSHFPAWLKQYLLSPVFQAVLHQRGIAVFHGSVVHRADGCVVLLGDSGKGKSTTAAQLCLHDSFQLLADDSCAVFESESGYRLLPAIPRLRLLQKALEMVGRKMPVDRSAMNADRKIEVVVQSVMEAWDKGVSVFVELDPQCCQTACFQEVRGIEKATALLNQMIWTEYLHLLGGRDWHFQRCMQLAATTPFYKLVFDKRRHPPKHLASLIVHQLQQCRKSGRL